MSLSRLTMRIAAARALRGATLAEDRVFDSAIDPLDHAIAEDRRPLIVVYTDDHSTELRGRAAESGPAECALILEVAIASRVLMPGGVGDVEIAIPHTDEGLELSLDIIEHQAVAALARGHSQWSRVWQGLVPRITQRQSVRAASTENGVRFAARQVRIACDLTEAPMPGKALPEGGAWAPALAALEADPDLEALAGIIRALIEGETVADWRRAAAALGISTDAAAGLGIAPASGPDDDLTLADEGEAYWSAPDGGE